MKITEGMVYGRDFGPMSEDLQLRIIDGPPRYTSRTDKAVEHITIADQKGMVIGYIYANDEDDAVGWQARPAAGFAAQNLAAAWFRILQDAKKRGLKPSAALDELERSSAAHSHVVPNSRQASANLAGLKILAGVVPQAPEPESNRATSPESPSPAPRVSLPPERA